MLKLRIENSDVKNESTNVRIFLKPPLTSGMDHSKMTPKSKNSTNSNVTPQSRNSMNSSKLSYQTSSKPLSYTSRANHSNEKSLHSVNLPMIKTIKYVTPNVTTTASTKKSKVTQLPPSLGDRHTDKLHFAMRKGYEEILRDYYYEADFNQDSVNGDSNNESAGSSLADTNKDENCYCPFCIGEMSLTTFLPINPADAAMYKIDSKSFLNGIHQLRTSVKVDRDHEELENFRLKKHDSGRESTKNSRDYFKVPARIKLWNQDDVDKVDLGLGRNGYQNYAKKKSNYSVNRSTSLKSPMGNYRGLDSNLKASPVNMVRRETTRVAPKNRLLIESGAGDAIHDLASNDYWNQVFNKLKLNPHLSSLFYKQDEKKKAIIENYYANQTRRASKNPQKHLKPLPESDKPDKMRLWDNLEDASTEIPVPPATPVFC